MQERGSGGIAERRKRLTRLLDAADKLRRELDDAVERAGRMSAEDPEYHDGGVLLELLRGAPELIGRIEQLPAALTAAAAIVAVELQASDADRLRGLLIESYEKEGTTATHVRDLLSILAEAYAAEPDEPRTIN